MTLRGIGYVKLNRQILGSQDFAAAKASATAQDDNNLCWYKAMADVALDTALQDRGAALAYRPGKTTYLDRQGFVMLRLARYDDAIDLFSKAIKLRPMMATSLFGRSIAERRRGDTKAADDDLAEAHRSYPDVERQFSGLGLAP